MLVFEAVFLSRALGFRTGMVDTAIFDKRVLRASRTRAHTAPLYHGLVVFCGFDH